MVVRGMMCWGAGDGCSRHDVLGGGGWLFEA